jgi:hypothetical protein
MAKFEWLIEKWLPVSPLALRLALGGELVSPVDSVTQGYEYLRQYLPALKLDNSSDLLYRINRPRQSKTNPSVKINRLSTWGLIQGTILSLQLTGPGGPRPSVSVSPSHRPACRLELDVNTAPEAQVELRADDIRALLKEFTELASEIADQGDVE